MTRKKNNRAIELEQQIAHAETAQRQMENQALMKAAEAEAVSGYTDERDLINQLVGQVQMAQAFSKFTTVVSLTKLKYIKENKMYRVLSHKIAEKTEENTEEKLPTVGTWDGFCRLLGTTASKVDEDLKNLEVFGEEALNSLNSVGAGYRELRKLRKLPEEDRELIIKGEAVTASDKESLVELLDEMAAKHAKEKEALEKRAGDLESDLDVTRRVVEEKGRRITDLETELQRNAALTPDERAGELSSRLDREVFTVKSAMLGPRSAIKEIQEWKDAPRDLRHACAQAIARMRIALDEIQTEFMLEPVDLDIDDSWMGEAE